MSWALVVHDCVAQMEELLRFERFCEEVCDVVVRFDERHDDLHILHALANKKMTSHHVLDSTLMLRIVRHCDGRLVVDEKLRGLSVTTEFEVAQVFAEIERLFSCFGGYHNFRFCGGERYCGLFLGPP